jgi:hypothetical protein
MSRLVIGVVSIVLLAALISPWGLAKSHGAAALTISDHQVSLIVDHDHGHSHDDDSGASADHPHHAGDHTHENAHALPAALPAAFVVPAAWQWRTADAGPWPSLDGIERPPRV